MRCEFDFDLHQTPECQKERMAIFHFSLDVRDWYRTYNVSHPQHNWDELVDAVKDRFYEGSEEDVIDIFNKMQQQGA